MGIRWEDARDQWARQKVRQERPQILKEIVIESIEFEGGGEVQIGDVTWDYENPHITIYYRLRSNFSQEDGDRQWLAVDAYFDEIVREIVAAADSLREN